MEKIISPGVFTRENDQSYLPAGISQIGAAIIGPTLTGPAFKPTQVTSFAEFEAIFGTQSSKTYVPYTVKNYLRDAGVVTIVRVLGIDGWLDTTTDPTLGLNSCIEILASGSDGQITGVVLALTSGSSASATVEITGTNNEFYINSGSETGVTASFDLGSGNHVAKVFGTDPKSKFGGTIQSEWYCYRLFDTYADALEQDSPTADVTTGSFQNITFSTRKNYSQAITPWVNSQKITGTARNLFRFHTLSDGRNSNKLYKILVSEVNKPLSGSASYGKFNVTVRDYNDTDDNPYPLETFANCNLDPTSTDYILRKIGDQYTVTDSAGKVKVYGDYPNKSKYIRVEGTSGIANLSNQLVPFGHDAYYSTITGSNAPTPTTMSYQGTTDTYKSNVAWGIDWTHGDVGEYFDALPDAYATLTGTDLNLDDKFGHNSSSLYSGSLSGSDAPTDMLRFSLGFQGGWDGIPPNRPIQVGGGITANNVMGYDLSSGGAAGTTAYKKAIDTLNNEDEIDINMLVLPGVMQKYHSSVTEDARLLCNSRQDCFYVMDCVGQEDSIQDAVDSVNSIDNNYSATYYPWVKIQDTSTNELLWVPPSVVMPGAIAFNDRVAAEWYAPAGLNRGGLDTALEVRTRLTHSERDTLYNARVNPIAIFPNVGIVAWGQKTLQSKSSALDRINVRRLLIRLKKYIASTSRYLVFEQNTAQTRNRFLAMVNPYLESVQYRSGLYAFKVVMDDSNNTPDIIDRNMLVGHIYIQPTRTAEFIELTFNVLPTGAAFQ